MLTKHLGDGEHDVGRGHTRLDGAGELEAHDARDQHRDGLAEHRGLGLDAADAPAEHAETVLHGGVRVGTDTGVGVGLTVTNHHAPGQVLDVDLVDDAGARGDDLEVVERALAPTEELVTLLVALVLDLDVLLEGVRSTEGLDDDRVVDDHLGRRQRVDLVRVATEGRDCLAHGGQVDNAGNTGEVLHDHARRRELDLGVGLGIGIPVGQGVDVRLGDVGAVLGTEQVLREDLEGVGELLGSLDRRKAVDLVSLAADLKGPLGAKAVNACCHVSSTRGVNVG